MGQQATCRRAILQDVDTIPLEKGAIQYSFPAGAPVPAALFPLHHLSCMGKADPSCSAVPRLCSLIVMGEE